MTKQVIVMRCKYPDGKGGTTGLRKGKMIAQACHASMAFITRRLDKNEPITQVQKNWLDNSFTKICVGVDTEQELLDVAEKAKKMNVECHVITDNGKTEFGGIPTKTCLALGPDLSEKIDEVTGDLKLL